MEGKQMKKKKITISWAFGTNPIMQIDFGRFPAHEKNQLKVDEKFWNDYCNIRFQYEIMQKDLCNLVEKR
jgi:hypothetical protein